MADQKSILLNFSDIKKRPGAMLLALKISHEKKVFFGVSIDI
jgi:hypothetical protein